MTNPVPVSPGRYTKRPVTIEAMQWDGTAKGANPIIDWVLGLGGTCNYVCDNPEVPCNPVDGHHLVIQTLEGPMTAAPGSWIIRGIQGEFYPCKPDIFAGSYDEELPDNITVPHVPADMLASIEKHYENIRLVQRQLSVEKLQPPSWWTSEGQEPPVFAISSEVEVYGDRRDMAKRRTEPHILIQNGEEVG